MSYMHVPTVHRVGTYNMIVQLEKGRAVQDPWDKPFEPALHPRPPTL